LIWIDLVDICSHDVKKVICMNDLAKNHNCLQLLNRSYEIT